MPFGALALVAALPFASCITPPVVAEAHYEGWALESSAYPQDAHFVEIAYGDGDGEDAAQPMLRGLFVPSDIDAPVVVHFAESGASLTASPLARGQYHALAEIGFASLAVDYRGVGLSDGEPSPRKLGDDALAIWTTALGLVDGDADRLIVRGASLGTVATSSLLARGVRPAACIAFAPVRPSTVARLYGYALYWDPLVWFVAPLLRSFSPGDPLKWFSKPGIPRLVVIHPGDELLGERDFERLKQGVEASGGTVEVPALLYTKTTSDDPVAKALRKHIALTHGSYSVSAVEEEFLKELFPSVPDIDARARWVERFGWPEAVETVWSDEALRARLEIPLRRHRLLPPNLVLAAAQQLTDDELEAFEAWFMGPVGQGVRAAFRSKSFASLSLLLDLEDPGGRLPVDYILEARKLLGNDLDSGGGRRWSRERIDSLLISFLGFAAPSGRVFGEDGAKLGENEAWRFGVAEGDRIPFAEPGKSGRLSIGGLRRAFEADGEGRSKAEAGRRLRRCFLKASGLERYRPVVLDETP